MSTSEHASATLASLAEAVITTDVAGAITYLNATAERLTGWTMTEALGLPLAAVVQIIAEDTHQPIESIPNRCLREGRAVDLADGVLLLRRDGAEVPIADSAAPIQDRDGSTIGVVMVFHDVTERRRAARALSYDATHDALTGLATRKEFERRLARLLSGRAAGGPDHALCYLDLDRFKRVNDRGGHEAGDELLRTVGRVLRGQLRNRDTGGRLGGDEFGVLLEDCTLAKALETAEELRRAIEDLRCVWGRRTFAVAVSIGVIPITAAGGALANVLRGADAACYGAKRGGGNRITVAQPVRDLVEQRPDNLREAIAGSV
jgi:diguanylate cyclase (GGDEF)-like protein/PAS domain S-box-containing protein